MLETGVKVFKKGIKKKSPPSPFLEIIHLLRTQNFLKK